MKKSEIIKYVESQRSLHLYEDIQEAFIDVLGNLSDEQFQQVTENLIIMALHTGKDGQIMNGQVMHFNPRKSNFAVMQLYVARNLPDDVLKWVIAHELGHVMQGRNWEEPDGEELEDNASEFAERIGYPKTQNINEWLTAHIA
jgi:hypothetical protein